MLGHLRQRGGSFSFIEFDVIIVLNMLVQILLRAKIPLDPFATQREMVYVSSNFPNGTNVCVVCFEPLCRMTTWPRMLRFF